MKNLGWHWPLDAFPKWTPRAPNRFARAAADELVTITLPRESAHELEATARLNCLPRGTLLALSRALR